MKCLEVTIRPLINRGDRQAVNTRCVIIFFFCSSLILSLSLGVLFLLWEALVFVMSRTLNWSRTAKSSVKVSDVKTVQTLVTNEVQQHVSRSDPTRPAQSLNLRPQQVAEFSESSERSDRLGHRAKEKLLDRVSDKLFSRGYTLIKIHLTRNSSSAC